MPTTKAGTTEMAVAKAVMPRSSKLPCRVAASTPRASPPATPRTRPRPATDKLTEARWKIWSATDWLLAQLRPKSPVSDSANQSA